MQPNTHTHIHTPTHKPMLKWQRKTWWD